MSMSSNVIKAIEEPKLFRFLTLMEMLPNPETRTEALIELEMNKDQTSFAQLLWTSFGCVAALVQEIVMIYPQLTLLSPNAVTTPSQSQQSLSNRVGCVFGLLNVLAHDEATRPHFVKANIIYLLYPFLDVNHTGTFCEYLRLNSLAVICSLLTCNEDEVIQHLIDSELFFVLTRVMEFSNDLARTVSTYSFYLLISSNNGLIYMCSNTFRLTLALVVLGKMVYALSKNPDRGHKKLLKHIIRCYARMDKHKMGREFIRVTLPNELSHKVFGDMLDGDEKTKATLMELLKNTRDHREAHVARYYLQPFQQNYISPPF